MAVLKTYPLDLTGTLVSNKITGEVRTITKDADRVFIPTGGPFHTKSLKVWSGTTLLQPVKDYVALELNREGTIASGKEICNVLFIKHSATSFKIDYQVIGGIYSDYSNELADLINSTPIDKLNILTWGSILGKPSTFPPTSHVHYPYEWRGYTQVIHLLENLRQLITAGDQAQIASVYQYIETNIKNIAADYIDKNGLFFIDKTPTPNGNVMLGGLGTLSAPLKLNLADLIKELDVRYFQNSINPLSRIGAISDSFLPISSGFFNCLVPLNRGVSLSAVGNVERNGDLLMLTPATNGEITRYVYGYVRDWTNDPNITRYRPTNQQYRPPGLAANEEIMDLFGYHEQSMIGSIFTVNADGSSVFKENCVIWLNGTLAAESHVLERVGRELLNALPDKNTVGTYSISPKVVKMRRGERFLIYFNDNSGIHCYRWDSALKKFVQTTNWKAILQKNIVEPNADQKVSKILSTTETVLRTGQDFCRPFAWFDHEKTSPNEMSIFDVNLKVPEGTITWTYGNPGNNRKRMGCRVVGDTIKVMANITYQAWINDPAYRGGSRECLGFTLELYPLEQIPTYKWIRHSRENGVYSTGRGSSALNANDRGYSDFYETSNWTSIPMDLFSMWEWWENLQPRSHIQLNDGRIIVWAHPAVSGYPIFMQAPYYRPEGEYDVEKMFILYHNTRQWRHPALGAGGTTAAYVDTINFPAPTVNRVNSSAAVLADGTIILADRRVEPRTLAWDNVNYTAYRPSAKQIDYATATNGVIQGFDTSANRIVMVGDYNGKYDLIPWISARRANGAVKVGALWWYKPMGAWKDQTMPANIRIDWGAKQFIREELYTFTEQGFNVVQDFLTTFIATPGATTLHFTWSIMASPIDPNSGLLFCYAARDNRTANEYVIPVKFQWGGDRRLAGVSINPSAIVTNTWTFVPATIFDPRFAWSRLQWVIDHSADMTQVFWAGKMPNASQHQGDTLAKPGVMTFREVKNGSASTWTHLATEGTQDNTSGYKTLVATPRGIGMMTDEVGYGVFRALRPMKGLEYVSGTIYKDEKPFIYVTPRPPSDFSLSITDLIDIQLGGVYGQIESATYSLTDPTVSDVIDPRNKTIFIYMTLELGKPRINFREVPMAESIYTTYLGKCITDDYGVMEIDIQPVTRIGNYRPSATPRGASFSVSSGTADTERLLNWDANIFSSEGIGDKSTIPEGQINSAGTYDYLLAPGDAYFIEMLGGGGGGGGSVYTGGSMDTVHGKAGEGSSIWINDLLTLEATPGFAGTGGWWGNGSHMSPGDAGPPGMGILHPADYPTVLNQIQLKYGFPGKNAIANHGGGGVWKNLGPYQAGVGGDGGNGIGDNGNSNGGGGGGAGYVSAKIKNSTNETVRIRVIVGAGGAGGRGSTSGAKGKDGTVLFTKAS